MTNLDGMANLDEMAKPKIDNNRQTRTQINRIHASKFQGVFLLRSPKRRRQLTHTHKGIFPHTPVTSQGAGGGGE